jgi:hypothetical protein
LQKLKGRLPLRIEGDQFSVENKVALERGERLDDLWEALVKHFLVARKQRDLSSALHGNAAIAVEFDLKGPLFIRWQAVTGLHCIGSINGGSVRFRIVWCFVVLASACSIFLAANQRSFNETHSA